MFSTSISLIIPSKTQSGVKLDLQQNIQTYSIEMSTIFGGCTSILGKGSYVMSSGVVMFEDVAILHSYTDKTTFKDFINLALQVKKDLNQECVVYTINNVMYFI